MANALLDANHLAEPEETYPLDLAFCPECSLVQITETVSPEKLFGEYVYLSSVSETMVNHAESLADRLVRDRQLGPGSLVVEIASNDGYLLRHYQRYVVPVLGIEPARNIAAIAEGAGIPTIGEFFGPQLARRLVEENRHADVLHANNVLAHVADLNGVVQAAADVLKDSGVWIIEVPYLIDLIDNVEFDTIYHEHLCYFSLTSIDALFRRHGLEVVNIARIALHGGSIQVQVQHVGQATPDPYVQQVRDEESRWGVSRFETYKGFGKRVEALRESLLALLHDLHAQGKRLAAYGASAKGSTLLNYFGVEPGLLDFVVDRSNVKQGRYTPGTHLPILPPSTLCERQPDYVLLLTWNFKREILAQQARFRQRGGRFIVPVPDVSVI